MPLITAAAYLFGQILSFALPAALLISFATFFYRQARKAHEAAPRAKTTPGAAAAGTPAVTATTSTVPDPPAAPTPPYSDL